MPPQPTSNRAKSAAKSKVSPAQNPPATPTPARVPTAAAKPAAVPHAAIRARAKANAKEALKHFTLSKFAKSPPPANFVERHENPLPKQKELMAARIANVPTEVIARRVMTFALPPALMKNLAPGLDPKGPNANLSDIMTIIAKYRRGNEFIARGNPALRRLMIQSQINQIISNIKNAK